MAHPETEDFQLYFSRIKPIYHQLFNLAHAITGNCEQAEYALQYAMLDCWSAGEVNASHHGFRESLRSSVIRAALKETRSDESDWDSLHIDADNGDPFLRAIAQESSETRRLLVLRHGCGFSLRRIARTSGMDRERARILLNRFDARTRRRLPAAQRRKYELLIARVVRSQLNQPDPAAPAMGNVFRTFQSDASAVARPSRLPARILRMVVGVILAIFCVVMFWFTAIMMQPAVMEAPTEISQTLQQS